MSSIDLAVAVDIGGTFTDVSLRSGATGEVWRAKTPSTPADPSEAFLDGIRRALSDAGLSATALSAVLHGTTVATNMILEDKGARAALVATRGFRHVLSIGRQDIPRKANLYNWVKPERPIPPQRIVEVAERVGPGGEVLQALDEASVREVAAALRDLEVAAVAVCLLHSFANPAHELRTAEILREELPGVAVTASTDVLPVVREYERTLAAVLNAIVMPGVSTYVGRLEKRLAAEGVTAPLLLMQSNGGVMTREYLKDSPIRVLASGPAGGVIGGAATGAAKGAKDILCVDMGGTSYDVSIIRDGQAPAQAGWNWHHRYLVATPMVQVETLGAGGGPIRDATSGVLHVGPASAGADPGPVCYGRGGERPTVTDAILTLGLLSDEEGFAGGGFQLSRDGVNEALSKYVAAPMNCSVEDAAFDCWRVVNANMTQAVRRLTAEKGCDPRELTMLAYGGNGPVFAAIQAQELGIERVLVPRTSPGFSATGALTAQPCIDEERSYLVSAVQADPTRLRELWGELGERAESFLAAAGFTREQLHCRYQVNLRYPGQNWSLTVNAIETDGARDLDFVNDALPRELARRFHELHQAEYGHARNEEAPALTGVRLQASTRIPQPTFTGGHDSPRSAATPYKQRRANLGQGFANTDIYRGADLAPGHEINGPAIIEETFTTIVVYPLWCARLDETGDYELRRAQD